MKAKEIIKIIENICPERLAYSWDNVGLLCGDENKDVKGICNARYKYQYH